MNDGILKIYQKIVTSANNSVTDVQPLKLVSTAFYGDLSFIASEYYGARQSMTEVVRRVRVHQDRGICNKHVIGIAGTLYEVGRVFSTIDKGVAVTDITLERVTTQYDVGGV